MSIDEILKSFENEEDTHHESVGSEPIVFLHDSCQRVRGEIYSFKDDEYEVLMKLLGNTKLPAEDYQFVASINMLGVSEKDVTTEIIQSNRAPLEEKLKQINPKLIYVLGNLAMKVLLRMSGISNKRGKEFWIDIDGVRIPVVPVYHPFSLYSEPKLRDLFVQDIETAYDKFVLNKNKLAQSSYTLCKELQEALDCLDEASSKEVVSVDIETTGLDYKKDKITSIGFATGEKRAFVIPIHHRESSFSDRELATILVRVSGIMGDPAVGKVFHNCKFDLKFLRNWGVESFNNIHDTQVMHALIDENKPHGLMDIVKQYWPTELEEF